jgi:tubulin-specific chaperone C
MKSLVSHALRRMHLAPAAKLIVPALQEQMDRLNTTAWSGGEREDAVNHCLAGINRLSREVTNASTYVPAYDQRTYGDV